jgi:FtsH-binding integral membrane protein
MSVSSVRNSLLLYAGLMGLSLSVVFLTFNFKEITTAFFITASMFAGMSIYGYATKKDLSSFSSILIMGIWGVFIASIVNIFLRSGAFSMGISIISVIIFTAMVAYDTQKLRRMYYSFSSTSNVALSKIAIFGAMQLYIDFVAIFVHILNLLRLTRDN